MSVVCYIIMSTSNLSDNRNFLTHFSRIDMVHLSGSRSHDCNCLVGVSRTVAQCTMPNHRERGIP